MDSSASAAAVAAAAAAVGAVNAAVGDVAPAADADAAATAAAIPCPPPSPLFDTIEDLYRFLQGFHRDNGAAIVRWLSRGKREVNGITAPTEVFYRCDRGGKPASTSVGLRKTATKKIDCPYRVTAKASKASNWKWSYHIPSGRDRHNHGPSLHPSAHIIHRRRTPAQRELEKSLSKHTVLRARDMDNIIRDSSAPEAVFFTQRDIYNDRQRLRRLALGDTRLMARADPPTGKGDLTLAADDSL